MNGRVARSVARLPIGWHPFLVTRNEHEAALIWGLEESSIELWHVLDTLDAKWLQTSAEEGEAHARVTNEEADMVEHNGIIATTTTATSGSASYLRRKFK
jgi:hypothetical protein